MRYDVFLSYNSLDRPLVSRVAEALEERGCSCFVDQSYLLPGRDWVAALEMALADSQSVAVFLGPHEMGRWQQRERAWALDRQAESPTFAVIPVLLPDCKPPLGFLKQNTWIDLRRDPTDARQLDGLVAAIRGETIAVDASQHPQATVCPYRGLLYFREEDAAFFFGRDTYIDKLVEKVEQRTLVAVVGASGSGKSSVVRAGLVPRLRSRDRRPVWEIATMVPGDEPLHALAGVILPLVEPELAGYDLVRKRNEVAQDLGQSKTPLWDLVAEGLQQQPGTDRLLLVVDQWEELYTQCENADARRRFIDQLLDATSHKQSPLSVVLTVRSDFYDELLQDRKLLDHLEDGKLDLGPMNDGELRAAIEQPANIVELSFQDGLVDRLLADARNEPGRLPLLEFALEELWKRQDRGRLTHAAYEKLGQLSGAIATRAETVYAGLNEAEQAAASGLFRRLVRAGSKTEEDTRRRAELASLDETTRLVARRLADERLLVTTRGETSETKDAASDTAVDDTANPPEEANAKETVEVAHEEMLRRWGRLKQWVNEDRQFLLWQSRIDLKLEEFERDGNSALLRRRPLQEAKKFYPDRRTDLGERQCGFLDASLKAQRRLNWRIRGSVCLAIVLAAAIGFVWHRSNQQQKANSLVTTLVGTKAATVEPYLEQLSAYQEIAIPRLRHEFANADRSPWERAHAAYALVRFDAAGIDELTFLLDGVSTLPKDESENLIRALATVHGRQPLNNKLKQCLDQATSNRDRGRYAALALWLGITDGMKDVCELKRDPSSRTALINDFKEFPGELKNVAQVLGATDDRNLRSALCLAIGTLGVDAGQETGEVLQRLFVQAPDGGTHSAAGWALRQQGLDPAELLKLVRADRAATDGWFVNGQGMTMVRIPAGTFEMGSKDDVAIAFSNEKPAHPVTLTKQFWLSDREVSVEQFLQFVQDADYTGAKPFEWEGYFQQASPTGLHPIQAVSWLDAVRYCNWLTAEENKSLSEEEKLTAYYDEEKWEPVPGANGYRLPTEAEWEYACRAGSNTAYCFGDDPELLAEYAVYGTSTAAVCASKLPNAWGLFDMHGNVFEWCADWYDSEYYARSSKVDPSGPARAALRVIRGGSWADEARNCRSAVRYGISPEDRYVYLGFRLAAVPPSQQARDKSK